MVLQVEPQGHVLPFSNSCVHPTLPGCSSHAVVCTVSLSNHSARDTLVTNAGQSTTRCMRGRWLFTARLVHRRSLLCSAQREAFILQSRVAGVCPTSANACRSLPCGLLRLRVGRHERLGIPGGNSHASPGPVALSTVIDGVPCHGHRSCC